MRMTHTERQTVTLKNSPKHLPCCPIIIQLMYVNYKIKIQNKNTIQPNLIFENIKLSQIIGVNLQYICLKLCWDFKHTFIKMFNNLIIIMSMKIDYNETILSFFVYVTTKPIMRVNFEIYTSPESWINKLSIDVWFFRIGQYLDYLKMWNKVFIVLNLVFLYILN